MRFRWTIVFVTVLISCTPPAYYPSQQIMPRLTRQGNVQASAGLGSGFEYMLALAGSPVDHVGVYAGHQRILPKFTTYEHTVTEGGMGLYTGTTSGNYWALYSSYGFGSVDAHNGDRYVENKFHRYSITIMNSPKVGERFITTALRGDYHKMYEYTRYEIHHGVKTYTAIGNRNRFFIGPSVGTNIAGPGGTLQAQLGCSAKVHRSDFGKWISGVYLYASAAIMLDFNSK